jgi:hypothetical protein
MEMILHFFSISERLAVWTFHPQPGGNIFFLDINEGVFLPAEQGHDDTTDG